MRWTSLWLWLAVAAPAAAQEWPKPTEAGRKGLDALIRRCVEAGALKEAKDQRTGAVTLSLADAANVEAVLRADPAAVTPAVRDALIARWPNAGATVRAAVVSLLRPAGAAGDGRAAGFAALFEGMARMERDPGSALPLFREATDRFRAAGDRIWQATGFFASGTVLLSLARPREALVSFQDSLAIRRTALGERHPDVATSYNNLGSAYRALGEPAKAVEYHDKALAIRRTALGERHPDAADSYNNLASTYHDLGEPAKAVEYLQKALAIRRTALGEQHPDAADSYNNLASTYHDLGEPAEAVEYLQKALAIRRTALGEQHPDVAQSYNNLANAYDDLGEPARAVKSFDLALRALVEPTVPPGPDRGLGDTRPRALPFTAEVLLGRGEVRAAVPGADPATAVRDALADFLAAADVLERLRGRDAGTGGANSERAAADKVHMGEQVADLAPLTVRAAARLAALERRPGRLVTAYEAAEQGSARVFLEALGRSRAAAVGGVEPEALAEEQRLRAELRQADARVASEIDLPAEKVHREAAEQRLAERQKAEDALNAFVARLERQAPRYAALKYPRPCSLDEARACLAEDEVALHYVLGSGGSSLLVVAPKAAPGDLGLAVYDLPKRHEIAELIATIVETKTLDDAERARELGAKMYRMLLAPAAEATKGKNLVIIPGGELGQLPFEVLVEPVAGEQDGRWLVEGHRTGYAPSLTALHLIRQWEPTRGEPARPLWALGDPIYQADDSRLAARTEPKDEGAVIAVASLSRGSHGATFPRLAGSGLEVQRLREMLGAGPDDLLLGPRATEAAVKRASQAGVLARYRYVHFACHGVLGQRSGTKPALVLSLEGDQRGEDGLLRVDEVTELRLNADLAVLSACRTGQGQVFRAEGVSGLAQAFLFAGCRGVVCSLWRVDDEATSELMAGFYGGLKAGLPAADALRRVQREMIRTERPPSQWAPFVLIGK
jgi:CHAT domain-containing protein/tetratricopeptide (TPR) repeat protein